MTTTPYSSAVTIRQLLASPWRTTMSDLNLTIHGLLVDLCGGEETHGMDDTVDAILAAVRDKLLTPEVVEAMTTDERIERVAQAVTRLTLTHGYAANDPEVREIARAAIAALDADPLEDLDSSLDGVHPGCYI